MQLRLRSTPYLGVYLNNDSEALELKAPWRTTLNSTGNDLSALGAILESSEKPNVKII